MPTTASARVTSSLPRRRRHLGSHWPRPGPVGRSWRGRWWPRAWDPVAELPGLILALSARYEEIRHLMLFDGLGHAGRGSANSLQQSGIGTERGCCATEERIYPWSWCGRTSDMSTSHHRWEGAGHRRASKYTRQCPRPCSGGLTALNGHRFRAGRSASGSLLVHVDLATQARAEPYVCIRSFKSMTMSTGGASITTDSM